MCCWSRSMCVGMCVCVCGGEDEGEGGRGHFLLVVVQSGCCGVMGEENVGWKPRSFSGIRKKSFALSDRHFLSV